MGKQPQEQIPLHRHYLAAVHCYDVTDDQLQQIEAQAENVGTDLTFATFTAAIFISFFTVLATTDIKSDRMNAVFVAVEVATFFLTFFFAWRWRHTRGELKKIIQKIRSQDVIRADAAVATVSVQVSAEVSGDLTP